MFNTFTLDTTIAFSGYGAGLVVGCIDNFRKTKSLFKKPDICKKYESFILTHLEANRDKAGQKYKGLAGILKPGVWNPFVPLEHLLPLSLVIINQLFIAIHRHSNPNISTLASKSILQVLVLPVILNSATLYGGSYLRFAIYDYLKHKGINASGHALAQSASAINKFFVFNALRSLGISSNLYRTTAAVTTLSDFLWTYRTASAHHSVIEMAVITLFMGCSFSAIHRGYLACASLASKFFSSQRLVFN